jgi:hypothetical protein
MSGFPTRKGRNKVMRDSRLGLSDGSGTKTTAPLGKLARKAKPEGEVAFRRMVEWITTDMEGFLPNEIEDLGVVSMDAWDDIAPESASAALVDLEDESEFGGDGDAYYLAHAPQLKAAVIAALQRKGVRVVPTRRDALRLLVKLGKLNEDHLSAFENETTQDVSAEEAASAVQRGQEAYTIQDDGGVVAGIQAGGRYFTVKEEEDAV